jgi:hypothetical protein
MRKLPGSDVLLSCLVIGGGLFAGCTRYVNVEDLYPVCQVSTVGIPRFSFEGVPDSEILDSLRVRGLLPEEGVVRALRLPPGELYESRTVERTSGPRLRNPAGFRQRLQQVGSQASRGRYGGVVAAFVDAKGDVIATREPAPRPFLSEQMLRMMQPYSAAARGYDASRLVQQSKFDPAVYDGCRIASWVIVPVNLRQPPRDTSRMSLSRTR